MPSEAGKLRKDLGLFDVFAIAAGAMFSSGFFLLPGLAAAQSGPSVFVAYFIASLLAVPTLLSQAELATAMPKAGGAYYFLDRAFGPMVGTVGGLGTWLALVLKSAFALIGMGAYLTLFLDLPVTAVALVLTLLFTVMNVLGAKETTRLQNLLVTALLGIMGMFLIQGLAEVAAAPAGHHGERFSPFLPFGWAGLASTVGLVFVSYAGLTKVASVAEEVRNPDRNIPLGMVLALIAATVVYVGGVYLIVALVDPSTLHADLTPVATAAGEASTWIPAAIAIPVVSIAAVAAFASTANAGILASSRYLLAMARDRLTFDLFERVGRFGTPTAAVLATALFLTGSLLLLDVMSVAKLASAFQLLLFALLNLAVIVMRESRLANYQPGFRSPLYPWVQILGFVAPLLLIAEMGHLTILFTGGMVLTSLAWYFLYARERVQREGAVFHWFEQLGRRHFEGLESELRNILREKGATEEELFDALVTRAAVLELVGTATLEEVVEQVGRIGGERMGVPAPQLARAFLQEIDRDEVPVAHGVALPQAQLGDIDAPQLVLVRSRSGIETDLGGSRQPLQALIFLASPAEDPLQHLRILALLGNRVDDPDFLNAWLSLEDPEQLRQTLLREVRFLALRLEAEGPTAPLIGRALKEIPWPGECLVALVEKGQRSIIPSGETVLQAGDQLAVIGAPEALHQLRKKYQHGAAE